MPDLVTHVAITHLIRRPFELKKPGKMAFPARILLYLGTMLPDLLTRPWYILFPATHDWTLPFHTPLGTLMASGLFALLFEPALQRKAFKYLILGNALHFFLDGFQKQTLGNNFWLFPFTWMDFGYGILWSGEIMEFIPVWIALVLAMELGIAVYRRRK